MFEFFVDFCSGGEVPRQGGFFVEVQAAKEGWFEFPVAVSAFGAGHDSAAVGVFEVMAVRLIQLIRRAGTPTISA